MIKVNFFMKSGNIMEFECEEIKLTRNGFGDLVGYTVTHGDSKNRLMEVSISCIEGIVINELNCYCKGWNNNEKGS